MKYTHQSRFLKFFILGVVALSTIFVAQEVFAQTGSEIANNQVDKFESWDRDKNPSADWSAGQNDSYMEGETIPMRVQFKNLTASTAYHFYFCLDIDNTPPWAFTKAEPWNTTLQPAAPPSQGSLTSPDEGVQAESAKVSGLAVSYAGVDVGACTSGSRPQLSYLVEFTALAGDPFFVIGGHVAAPGDIDEEGGTVGIGQGASSVNGTFQARTATVGDKTLNFMAEPAVNLRISIDPLNATNAVGDEHTFTIKVEQTVDGSTWTPVVGASPTVTVSPTPDSVTDNCGSTDANGECTYVINSDSADVFTASASVTVNVGGTTITRTTGTAANGTAGGTGNATKNYVNLRISINPPSAVNAVNDEHTFTVKVEENTGAGWVTVQGVNPVVTFDVAPDSVTDNCNTTGTGPAGECTVVINNADAETFVASAEITREVSGVAITRETGTQANLDAGGSGDATKTYQSEIDSYRISIGPLAETNEVGDPHTFTVTVERNTGQGWLPISQEAPTVIFNPSTTPTANTCPDGTDANGQCTVTINSTTPGVFSASASVDIGDFGTVTTGTQENMALGGSDDATKTYVDLRISIDPPQATNIAGDPHVFNVTVEQNDGTGAGWQPVAAVNPSVTVSPEPTSKTDDCAVFGTGAGGACEVTINSPTPGVFGASASVTASVSGVEITRSTDDDQANLDAGGSGNAAKTYMDLRISIDPLSATNEINDPHTFTIKVEQNDSSGWVNVTGATPTVTFDPTITPSSDTCADPGTDGNGQCTVTINSAIPGTFVASASVTVLVGGGEGIEITRETGTAANDAAGGSDDATKTYEQPRGRLTIVKEADPADGTDFDFSITGLDGSRGIEQVLYRETFPFDDSVSGGPAQGLHQGWIGLRNGQAVGSSALSIYDTVNGSTTLAPVNSNPLPDASAPDFAGFWSANGVQGVTLFTEEYQFPASVLSKVTLETKHDVASDSPNPGDNRHRLAIRIGQDWYLSDLELTQSASGSYELLTFLDPLSLSYRKAIFDGNNPATAPRCDNLTTCVPGQSLPDGTVTGIGIFTDRVSGGQKFRIDNFTLYTDATSATFTLDDADPDDNDTVGNSATFSVLGDYSVVESIPEGWLLEEIECEYTEREPTVAAASVQGDGPIYTPNVENGELLVTVEPYDDITCTFENIEADVEITFVKVVANGPATPDQWTFDVVETQATDIPHMGTASLEPGEYIVTESGPEGYIAIDAEGVCSLEDGEIVLTVPEPQICASELGCLQEQPSEPDQFTCQVTNTLPQIILTPSYLVTSVEEGKLTGHGSVACYWITLSDEPDGNVVIDVDPNGLLKEVKITPTQITLNAGNWNSLTTAERSNFLCVRPVDDEIDEQETIECGDKSANMTSNSGAPYTEQECGDHKEFVEHTVNAATTAPGYNQSTPWTNETLTFLGRPGENFLEALVRDNDKAGVVLTESFAVSDVDEDGTPTGLACYWVTLKSKPAPGETVTVTAAADGNINVQPETVELSNVNWDALGAQSNKVCITPVDNDKIDTTGAYEAYKNTNIYGDGLNDVKVFGDYLAFVNHTVTSDKGDSKYFNNGAPFQKNGPELGGSNLQSQIDVLVREDDQAGTIFDSNQFNVVEGGSVSLQTRLASRPQNTVFVDLNISSSPVSVSAAAIDGATLSEAASLAFTPENWNIAQTVTLTVDDNESADGTRTLLVGQTTRSTDPNFDGLTMDDVATVTVVNNESAGVVVLTNAVSVAEGDSGVPYALVLTSQPSGPVTVNIVTDGQSAVDRRSVVFDQNNWRQPQQIVVSAVDDNVDDDSSDSQINHVVSSSDAGYDGLVAGSVKVWISDNDSAGVAVGMPQRTSLDEGVTTSYTLSLRSQPVEPVTLLVATDGRTTASPAAVTFSADNSEHAADCLAHGSRRQDRLADRCTRNLHRPRSNQLRRQLHRHRRRQRWRHHHR